MRHWLTLEDFTITKDAPENRRGGWEIRAINDIEQKSFEMWGREELLEIRFDASCIEANRR